MAFMCGVKKIVMNKTLNFHSSGLMFCQIPLNNHLKMLSGEDRGQLLTLPIKYPFKNEFFTGEMDTDPEEDPTTMSYARCRRVYLSSHDPAT